MSIITDPSIFNTASPESEAIGHIGNGFLLAACGMTLLVLALTIYIPWRYRATRSPAEPQQISGNRKLEVVMVGVPLLLVIFFFCWSVKVMSATMPDLGHHAPDIIITGHQWWWEISYPGTPVTTANELHLPVGRRLLVQLNSADVIHDWWVPAFGAKMDMIPGRNNHLWLNITKAGIYEGACSEFCGQQHAWMRIRVVAQSDSSYLTWLKARSMQAAKIIDSTAKAGQALFMHASCSNCHRIRGTEANGVAGPDLTHFATRTTMLAGMLANTPANVDRWLNNPQLVKPGAHMPRFIFNRDSIKMLTAYLQTLK